MTKGYLDFVNHVELNGWAQDEASPQSPVSVIITVNGEVAGRTVASSFRSDLRDAGIGNGRHAFSFKFSAPLAPDQRHFIQARTEDGLELSGSPATLEATTATHTGVIGHIDRVDRQHAAGWAQYEAGSDEAVALIITVNEQLAGRVIANLHRGDLEAAGIGSGRHAFEFFFNEPLSLMDRQVVRVRRELDGLDLPGSPITIDPPLKFDAETQRAISNLLARYDRDDQIDEKIAFFADHLDRLVQQKADLESNRVARRRDRDLLRRWGHKRTVHAAARHESRRALVIDDHLPALDRDAGSNAIVSHMNSLQRLGYEVSFTASRELRPGAKAATLQASGFQVHSLPFYGSVEELLWRQAGEFDLIYAHRVSNSARYSELIRQHFPKALKVFGVADLHHVRILRQAAVEQRSELAELARRLKFAELLAAAGADAVITHSDYEAEILRTNLPKANIHRVLWSSAPKPTKVPFGERSGMAFVGSYGHAPNLDAAKWLIGSLMPSLRQRAPDIRCYLVGSDFPSELKRMHGDNITITGQVQDLATIFDQVRLTIAPLAFGAGIKGKLVESLAAGVPCVHTAVAAEGMGLPGELDVCRGDDVQALCDAVIALHEDADLNQRCGLAGLKYVSEELSEHKLDLAMRRVVGITEPVGAGTLSA